jgi:hypothetical protein
MKKSIAIKWVKALRSGEYKQAKHSLYDGHKYCCLGVLCKIQGLEPKRTGEEYGFWSGSNFLPYPIWLNAGMSGPNPIVLGKSLSNLNDYGPGPKKEIMTFDEIAGIIQIFWKEL